MAHPPNESNFFDPRWPMQIFKQIIENEFVNEIHPFVKGDNLTNGDNWKTIRDSMYFSIIHFEIAYKLLIGIKISDIEWPWTA